MTAHPRPAAAPTATSPSPTALPRLLATLGRPRLADHLHHWGRRPGGGPLLIDEIARSGLVGRGGASFPTGRKWAAVASGKGVVVVANGTEGEPASRKDKTLLCHAPHLVLDGLALAAEALGATEAVICVDRAAPDVCQAVSQALGERILADVDPIAIRLEALPPGYVTGEESALVHWLNGGQAKPTFGPRPFTKGVRGRPTLVNNVETLAHVALIARFGTGWYRSIGTLASPGTALVTISGDVARPAVCEISLGTPLRDVLAPSQPTSPPQAVLIGGYSGTWLPASAIPTAAIEGPSLHQTGASLGCASMIVVGQDSCGLKAAASITRWMADQSAGQCGPCRNGLPAIADAMDRLAARNKPSRWIAQMERWMWMVDQRGACKHPDGVVRMVRSAIEVFTAEIDHHGAAGPCRRPGPPLSLPRFNPPR
jgi:NADH:ubiquinone oxidoreductase subunit F (NADH-binding)